MGCFGDGCPVRRGLSTAATFNRIDFNRIDC